MLTERSTHRETGNEGTTFFVLKIELREKCDEQNRNKEFIRTSHTFNDVFGAFEFLLILLEIFK